MIDGPLFAAVPPLRCHHQVGGRPRLFCAELARWMRPGNNLFMPAYFCDAHRSAADVPLPSSGVIRRVQVQVQVLFASTSWVPHEAEAEAVDRLEQAVQGAGGLVSLSTASSSVGRFAAETGQGEETGVRARRR